MSENSTSQSVLFPELFTKALRVQFDARHGSCDGGAILLKACDATLGLSRRLAQCLIDRRQSGKVEHAVRDLVRQRLFGIACGYADGNDAARLGSDPIHKLLLDRDASTGAMLASQPRLSRFENAAHRADLYRIPALGSWCASMGALRPGRSLTSWKEEGCDYIVAMAKDKRLARTAHRLMGSARRLSRRRGETAHV